MPETSGIRVHTPKRGGHSRGEAGKRYVDEVNFDEGLPLVPASTEVEVVEVAKASNEPGFPDVLTWEHVRSKQMPVLGESGLPESLQQDVPPRFRYWKCATEEDARKVRDALVEEGLFTPDTVRKVAGVFRRVIVESVQKMWLVGEYDDEPVVIPDQVAPVEKAAALLSDVDSKVLLIGEDHVEAFGLESVLETVQKFAGGWLISAKDTPENRDSLGECFRLLSRDDLIFKTNVAIEDPESVEWVNDCGFRVLKIAFTPGREIKLIKSSEERIVFGVVLEPDTVDSQGDTIPPEEIRQAAYKFMEDYQQLGLQHNEIVNGKLKLLESFIARTDFEEGGQTVKKGSWLMTERVIDTELWTKVKKGEITGFSIGGSAVKRPVQ